MRFPGHGQDQQIQVRSRPAVVSAAAHLSDTPASREFQPIAWLHAADVDPGTVVLTCANCGAAMDERKCKLICRCGYFLSCSDYY